MAKLVKHDFVDEYPYIAYAEKVDTAASAAGGAGGFAIVSFDGVDTLGTKAGELFTMMQTQPVFMFASSETGSMCDLISISAYDAGTGYEFNTASITFTAATADDYPVVDAD